MNETNDISALIDNMAGELRKRVAIDEQTAMVGIHTGGVWIAQRLHTLLGINEPLGELDISFYRDDFTRIGMNPQVRPSQLPFSVDDYGRPASITLAVLVERDGRELPIEATVTGQHMELGPREHVKLAGPEPLQLEVNRAP